jgi:inosine/xanthosine triphosphatase
VGTDRHGAAATSLSVVVASRNPAKVNAVRAAFGASFPGATLDIVTVTVDSGVADQPVSDEETRRGALNRARNARARRVGADYWVGLEGGVETIDGELLAFAWMAVLDATGHRGMARSPTLPLPPDVRMRVARGEELGTANDAVFGTVGSKAGGGAFGLLSGGRFTREGVYAQTLCLALLPFINPVYRAEPEQAIEKPEK